MIPLSRNSTDHDIHQRICQWALIDISGFKANIFNVHLSLSLQARKRTSLEIKDFIKTKERMADLTVLMGDFNQEADGPIYAFYTSFLRDADQSNQWTFSQHERRNQKKIDWILYDNKTGFEMVSTFVTKWNSESTLKSSDHLGVMSVFVRAN